MFVSGNSSSVPRRTSKMLISNEVGGIFFRQKWI